ISGNTVDFWVNKAVKANSPAKLIAIKRDIQKIFNAMNPKKDANGKFNLTLDGVNPFFDSTITDGTKESKKSSSSFNIMGLVKDQNKINPVIFEASFITGDGKSKYAFSNNSYLTH